MSGSQLEVFVVSDANPDKGCWAHLPISKEDFLASVATIDVNNPEKDSALITMVWPELEVIKPHLKPPFDLNELNLLASKLEQLAGRGDEQYRIFAANLQAERHCGSVAEMINLLGNLEHIDLQPAFTVEQYGAFRIELAQDEFANEMDALEDSESPTKTSFADYISDLERCLDIKSYGRLISEREGGVFTDFGYLSESAAFQEVYRGAQDIPTELQVSPFRREEERKSEQPRSVIAKIHKMKKQPKVVISSKKHNKAEPER